MKTETIIGALIGLLTAVLADLTTYRQARLSDPNARFDWPLAVIRWLLGAVAGAGAGLGVGEVAA